MPLLLSPTPQVPGLAENRPSVLRGDALYVTPVGTSGREYQGFVHMVRLNEVSERVVSDLVSSDIHHQSHKSSCAQLHARTKRTLCAVWRQAHCNHHLCTRA